MAPSIGLGIGLGSVATLRGGGFSPSTLFASGEDGAWYEPGVGSLTLASGSITAASAGDPVGFQLDQSQGAGFATSAFTGLGAEEFANADFSAWTGDNPNNFTIVGTEDAGSFITEVGSGLRIVSDGDLIGITSVGTISPGKWVEVSLTVDSISSGALFFGLTQSNSTVVGGTNAGTTVVSTAGTHRLFLRSVSPDIYFSIKRDFASGACDATISAFSVREIPGNHATQPTAASRPTLRASPTHLEDDLTDDALNWDAPAGTYTIARVNSAGTVTIQTSQALSGSTDILLEETIAGYVAIDRALTAGETSDLTAYLEGLV